MRPVQFAIVETAGAWTIRLDGEPLAHFKRQVDAIACAADLAATSQRDGRVVEVLVQDGDGEIAVLEADDAFRSRSAAG